MASIRQICSIPQHLSGERLDVAAAELFPDYSRSRLQQWIQQGHILLDGHQVKPRVKVVVDQQLQLEVDTTTTEVTCAAQDIPLDIVYQDEALIVLNKPAGLVVHPAAGHRDGTLQNALLFFDPALQAVPRAGIIHRLDKDTSGIMVVARSLQAHAALVAQLQAREIHREYQALVQGLLTGGGTVDAAIGRHPHDRKRMALREDGKAAVTHYRLLHRYRAHSHLHLKLETGRTHQIRVHMQSLRHPIVGDPVYGGRARMPAEASQAFIDTLKTFRRQALHAWQLGLQHPLSGEQLRWQVPLAADMQQLIAAMQQDELEHA